MLPCKGTLGAAVPLLFSLAVHAGAVEPAQKAEPPAFKAEVALVAVPVFVTDKTGRAVRGLTAEDFEVEDEGKRVRIVAFQAVDVDAPVPDASRADLPVAIQAEAPRQFVLLIDLRFSPAAGLYFGRKAATAFVRETLAPGDLVAVATSGQSGLKVLTNFTSDHANVARVLEGKGFVGALRSDPLGLSGVLAPSTGPASLVDRELASQDALLKEADESLNRHSAHAFVDDLATLVEMVSPLRGRKQVVLLSEGYPELAWNAPASLANSVRAQALHALMRNTTRRARESDVLIHTVSLHGIEGPVDVASRTGRDDSRGDGPPPISQAFKDSSGLGTLMFFSGETGGRFIRPRNDFGKALGEVDQISRCSYVIAFEAAEPAAKTSRPRGLKVRVRGTGLTVSHRASYAVPAPLPASNAAALRMQAGEAIAKGLSGGPLRLQLATLPYRDGEGQHSLHAALQIEGPALSEAAQGDDLALEVYGYVMGAGRVLDSLALRTSLDLSKRGAAVKGSGIRVLTAFPVSPGALDLRFFVRAGASGVTGSIQQNVAVPAFVDGEPVLSPPMFTLPPAGKVVVPFQPASRPPIETPFRLGSEAFVPDVSATLTPGRARDACVFVWRARTGVAPPLEVTGEMARRGEAPLPVRIDGAPRVWPDPDGFDRYIVRILPPAAAAGPYTLRLTFVEPGTGRTTRTEAGVVLEEH